MAECKWTCDQKLFSILAPLEPSKAPSRENCRIAPKQTHFPQGEYSFLSRTLYVYCFEGHHTTTTHILNVNNIEKVKDLHCRVLKRENSFASKINVYHGKLIVIVKTFPFVRTPP